MTNEERKELEELRADKERRRKGYVLGGQNTHSGGTNGGRPPKGFEKVGKGRFKYKGYRVEKEAGRWDVLKGERVVAFFSTAKKEKAWIDERKGNKNV